MAANGGNFGDNEMNENNVISHKIETSLGENERESLNRPAWTSEESTGMWEAHRFNHSRSEVRMRKEERK